MMCFILKTSLAFAAIGYLVALGLYFAPLGWHIRRGCLRDLPRSLFDHYR
jgi:hypothetical protein